MIMEILILCPFETDAGLISKAAQLAGNGPVRALVPAGQEADAARFGASRIHPLHTSAPIADERNFALWLAEKIRLWGSTVILAPATVRMRIPMGAQIKFVLDPFFPEERKILEERIPIAAEAVKNFCLSGLADTMCKFNNK